MSAQFVDALKGYEYFIDKRGKASLEDVNDFLKRINRSSVSQRTYNHYRSLMRYGFGSYFPINQFDVSRTLGQLPIAPDRRRYERERVEIETTITPDGSTWISARVIDKSIVGFGMDTLQELPIKTGDTIWVRMEQYNDIPAILIWKKGDNNRIRFAVRAIEFIATYRVSDEKMLVDRLTGLLIVKKTSEGSISWRELYNLMEKIDKLIDASSELIKSIGKVVNQDVKLAPSVLSSIKFTSPVEFILNTDLAIVILIIFLIRRFQFWRLEKERYKEITRTLTLDNDMRKFEIARKAIKSKKDPADLDIIKQLSDALAPYIKRALNIDSLPSTIFEPGSIENGILRERLLPAARDLAAGDDPDIEVGVKEDSSENNGD